MNHPFVENELHDTDRQLIGEIFKIDHAAGSEMLGISADNYRRRPHRARRDLTQWMHRKRGLLNPDNQRLYHL